MRSYWNEIYVYPVILHRFNPLGGLRTCSVELIVLSNSTDLILIDVLLLVSLYYSPPTELHRSYPLVSHRSQFAVVLYLSFHITFSFCIEYFHSVLSHRSHPIRRHRTLPYDPIVSVCHTVSFSKWVIASFTCLKRLLSLWSQSLPKSSLSRVEAEEIAMTALLDPNI